ncbi:MAG: hypothetical protein KatS3mg065_0314 [Chloroflexota bacterium]|nr:MAG: hypothetical protein KatS3mg065_0314 [Chloroflexota bacterium]
MPTSIEAYTAEGALAGLVPLGGRLRDQLEAGGMLPIDRCRWRRLDGRLEPPDDVRLPVDDLLLVVAGEAELPVHAVWHDVRLVVGPYRVEGRLPTLPGFDPARALARPTGTFVLVREARVELVDRPGPAVEHAFLLVNRYAVDEVASDLMLGFFFPGADLRPTRAPAGPRPETPATP